jgi:hypothetical protein
MEKNVEKINLILAEWNPIGVPENITSDEYRDYIPIILEVLEKKGNLMKVLEDILVNKMELEYDSQNKEHVQDLGKVYQKLLLCV